MTLTHQDKYPTRHFEMRSFYAKILAWWFEHQQRRQMRKIADMPDYLLRDMGLDHLIRPNPTPKLQHRWY